MSVLEPASERQLLLCDVDDDIVYFGVLDEVPDDDEAGRDVAPAPDRRPGRLRRLAAGLHG